MDLLGNKRSDLTSFLCNINFEDKDHNPEIIEINSEDESGSTEEIKILSDDETRNLHKINKDVEINSEGHSKGVGDKSEDVNVIVSKPIKVKNSVAVLQDCYVNLHKTIDQSEILNCKKCTKVNSRSNNRRLQCLLCLNFYSSKLYLKYHACAADNRDDNDFNNANFGTNTDKSTEKVKNFQCKHCRIKCKKFNILKKHYLQVHADDRPFDCKRCKKAYKDKSSLKKHEIDHTRPCNFHCKYCSTKYDKFSVLKRHYLQIHPKEKPFDCKKCGKTFKLTKALKKHEVVHTRAIQCKYCSMKFEKLIIPAKHYREFHPHEKPYDCKNCNKTFKWKFSLKIHTAVHTNFKCKYCRMKFEKFIDLNRHYLQFHPEENSYCTEFSKTVKSRTEKNEMVLTIDRPFVCTHCNKAFKVKRSLFRHNRGVHNGGRLYVCSECNRTFKSSDHLKGHKVIHTGLRPYSCKNCGKTYTFRSGLRAHQLSKTACKILNGRNSNVFK